VKCLGGSKFSAPTIFLRSERPVNDLDAWV
jgi:hypothetical protein